MLRIFISIIILISLTSCAVNTKSGYQKRDLERYQKDRTVAQYFLADIPTWANSSNSGKCRRVTTSKYINFQALRDSFSFDFKQAVQFQYMYNINYQATKKKLNSNYLTFADEANIFYNTSDKILAGILPFKPPKYKRISILWIDPLIKNGNLKGVKKIVNKPMFQKGHPVLITLCLSQKELTSFLKKRGLEGRNIRIISYEMLTMFNKDSLFNNLFTVNLSNLFKPEQKIELFIPGNAVPPEFKGEFKIKYIKGD